MRAYSSIVGLLCILLGLMGCRVKSVDPLPPNAGGEASDLTDVALGLPDKTSFSETQRKLLDGYRLVIEPNQTQSDNCKSPTQLDETKPWGEPLIITSLVQGCDYVVVVELGNLSVQVPSAGTSQQLTKKYFGNRVNSGEGAKIKASEIAGKATIDLRIALQLLPDGKAAGFGLPTSSATPSPQPSMSSSPPLLDSSDFEKDLVFISLESFKAVANTQYDAVLNDIMSHEAPGDVNNYSDLVTLGHETCHGIHAYIRNHRNNLGRRANGFYVLNNRAVLVAEPAMRKSKVAAHIPRSIRGSMFELYVTGQSAWDDTPLYIFDEWTAYVNGSAVGVGLFKAGLWRGGSRDAFRGTAEFTGYALAVAKAIRENDRTYFDTNKQFKAFLAWNIKRGMTLIKEGAGIAEFKSAEQDRILEQLKSSPDAEELRQFSRDYLGPAWVKEVLGF